MHQYKEGTYKPIHTSPEIQKLKFLYLLPCKFNIKLRQRFDLDMDYVILLQLFSG